MLWKQYKRSQIFYNLELGKTWYKGAIWPHQNLKYMHKQNSIAKLTGGNDQNTSYRRPNSSMYVLQIIIHIN